MDSFKTLQDEVSKALVSTTRSASRIASADICFQRSLNPQAGTQLDAQNARLLHLAQRLLDNAAASSDAVGPKLPDVEAVDANWRGVVDVIDSLLEKADTSLDEYTGVVKRLSFAAQTTAVTPRPNMADRNEVAKPQLQFDHVPTNNEVGGFRPLVTAKPHAKVPLEQCLKAFTDKNGREQYPHLYQTEIETYEYPATLYESSEPQQYKPFESTTAIFVDTLEALAAMLAELKGAKEIAIDLEHHDSRSYIGMVSLMQISTRDQDWIIDTLKPWRRKLECLNDVFADPSILKVLHGATMDIMWLQRDLGLYVVGLFDTYHAARSLGYPGASLAYLLERFVGFKAQKQYQTADWRIRPLGKELFEYARADTHFLLYIFDNMRNELLEKSDFSDPERNKVRDVLEKSKETALQRYEHPIYDATFGLGAVGWYKLISRTPVQFTPEQFAVFRAVHEWRDKIGRQLDESPLHIMPNHSVFSVARKMPADRSELFNATQYTSYIIRSHAEELLSVVAKAKKRGADEPQMMSVLGAIVEKKEAEWKAKSTNSQAPQPSAATTPACQTVPIESTLSSPATRADSSNFWGKLWSKTNEPSAPTINVDLALPLPSLTAQVFADPVKTTHTPYAEKPKHTFVPKEDRPAEDPRSDLFVVKQLGGIKRKRSEAPPEDGTPVTDAMKKDEIMLNPQDEDSEAARRAQEKAARKAAKKAQKKERASALPANDAPAFDYATAPSVLHAGEDEGQGKDKKGRKKKSKGFNAFSGMTDAPKGLPRAHKEIAGRSKTFAK